MMENKLARKAKELYVYSYPIVFTSLMFRIPREGFMHISHSRTLLKADGTSYKPNQDTLYSGLPMQLASSPYVVEIPEADGRYLLVDILDLKTDVIFATGSKHKNNGAGKYIILYRDTPVPEGYEDYEVVRSGDSRSLFLIRTETFGEEDYAKANHIQDLFVVKPLYPERIKDSGTPIRQPMVTYLEGLSVKEYYEAFTGLLEDTQIDDDIWEIFSELGIDAKHFVYDNLEDEVKQALEQGAKEGYEEIKNYSGDESYTSNGWTVFTKDVGNFGKKYLFRAYITWCLWGANLPEDSIYPITYTDVNGNSLESNQTYKIHFEKDELPKAKHFWSITLYSEPSGILVDNPYDRYFINSHILDRMKHNEDGSLDVILGRNKPSDEAEFYNWIPTPAKEEHFSLIMRIYGADEETLAGKRPLPVIRKAEKEYD